MNVFIIRSKTNGKYKYNIVYKDFYYFVLDIFVLLFVLRAYELLENLIYY